MAKVEIYNVSIRIVEYVSHCSYVVDYKLITLLLKKRNRTVVYVTR